MFLFLLLASVIATTTASAPECSLIRDAYKDAWTVIHQSTLQSCSAPPPACKRISMFVNEAVRKELVKLFNKTGCAEQEANVAQACETARNLPAAGLSEVQEIFGQAKNNLGEAQRSAQESHLAALEKMSDELTKSLCH